MRKLMLLAGVAALGLSMPMLAEAQGNGGGHGGGHGGGQGHGQAAHGEGNGGGHGHGHGNAGQGGGQFAGGEGRGHGHGRGARDFSRGNGHAERRLVREARRDQRRLDRRGRGDELRLVHEARLVEGRDWRGWSRRGAFEGYRGRRLAIGPAGCPPGLARHNVYCMPPGQLRKAERIGQRLALANLGYNIPDRYRYRFADNDRFTYRYGNDGAVYRFDRGTGLVSSVFPVTSSGLYYGEPLPLGYDAYNVPFAYRNYYPDTNDYRYRYDGNAIYRVNSSNNMVDGVVALLTGGTGGLGALGVGDRLPIGYDAYNVPLGYRDTYYDTPNSMYRYADGSIYQIDPQTQLIQSIISLLV